MSGIDNVNDDGNISYSGMDRTIKAKSCSKSSQRGVFSKMLGVCVCVCACTLASARAHVRICVCVLGMGCVGDNVAKQC